MSFDLPTLDEVRRQIGADIERSLPGTSARTRRSVLGVLAFAQAGAVNGLYAHLDYLHRNFLPDELADAEGVERWARLYELWYTPAAPAAGTLQISGNAGAVLPVATAFQFTQDQEYVTTSDVTMAGMTGQVDVVALTPGAASNLAAGSTVRLVSPVTGISVTATVAEGGITGGADAGGLDNLRAQVYRRMSEPPQGGTLADYETWALESHPSITRAWAVEHEQGAGTVTVRIVCDNNSDPAPPPSVVDTCAAYIGERRPAGRKSVYVLPPVVTPVNYRIQVVPNTTQVHESVASELRDLHRRDAVPGGQLLLSRIREAISIAVGESDNSVVFPTNNLVPATGQLLTVGEIEWL